MGELMSWGIFELHLVKNYGEIPHILEVDHKQILQRKFILKRLF